MPYFSNLMMEEGEDDYISFALHVDDLNSFFI